MDAVRALAQDQWRSFRALPPWVQAWVVWLVLANVVASLHRSPTGRRTRWATLLFGGLNVALLVRERGFGRSLSFGHLLVWPGLVRWLLRRTREPGVGATERRIAAVVAVTDAVSLAFDVVDAARWLAGERAVAGAEPC